MNFHVHKNRYWKNEKARAQTRGIVYTRIGSKWAEVRLFNIRSLIGKGQHHFHSCKSHSWIFEKKWAKRFFFQKDTCDRTRTTDISCCKRRGTRSKQQRIKETTAKPLSYKMRLCYNSLGHQARLCLLEKKGTMQRLIKKTRSEIETQKKPCTICTRLSLSLTYSIKAHYSHAKPVTPSSNFEKTMYIQIDDELQDLATVSPVL